MATHSCPRPWQLCSCSACTAGAQERPEPAAKDATVFGFKLHYLDAGRGQPVILLHGTGGEGARWMPTIRALAPEFRVIAPDQIGFGQSDKPLTTYHSGLSRFPARFMQAIGVPKTPSWVIRGRASGALRGAIPQRRSPGTGQRPRLSLRACGIEHGAAGLVCLADRERRDAVGEPRISGEAIPRPQLHHRRAGAGRDLIQRLRSAHTIESMQVAGDRGLGGLTEEEVRGIKAPTIPGLGRER